MGQHYSPYSAMNNNPVSMIDPTGGTDFSWMAGMDGYHNMNPEGMHLSYGAGTSFSQNGTGDGFFATDGHFQNTDVMMSAEFGQARSDMKQNNAPTGTWVAHTTTEETAHPNVRDFDDHITTKTTTTYEFIADSKMPSLEFRNTSFVIGGVSTFTVPSGSLLKPITSSDVKVTFKKGSDNKVNLKLVEYFQSLMKNAAANGINSVYISSTTNHPSNKKSAHKLENGARAMDIAAINGVPVTPSNNLAKILQNLIKNSLGYEENYGPFIINRVYPYGVVEAPWAREIPGGHYDHVHISVPK